MINGSVVGVVIDNKDPDRMHRIKVQFPVDDGVESSWCRMLTPMGGQGRGLVMLPDIGTEVLLTFAYRSLAPYVLGALYNGKADTPKPYRNDDENDDKRVFWSRNDHMVVFDDTKGAEQVGVGACASDRLDVTSAPIHHVLDAAEKTLTEKCDGVTLYEAKRSVNIRCKTFSLECDNLLVDAGSTIAMATQEAQIEAGGIVRATSPDTHVKTGAEPPAPQRALPAFPALHNPRLG